MRYSQSLRGRDEWISIAMATNSVAGMQMCRPLLIYIELECWLLAMKVCKQSGRDEEKEIEGEREKGKERGRVILGKTPTS